MVVLLSHKEISVLITLHEVSKARAIVAKKNCFFILVPHFTDTHIGHSTKYDYSPDIGSLVKVSI